LLSSTHRHTAANSRHFSFKLSHIRKRYKFCQVVFDEVVERQRLGVLGLAIRAFATSCSKIRMRNLGRSISIVDGERDRHGHGTL
jgi:hypothetical protein